MARAEVVRHYGGVSAEDRRAERRRKLLDAARELWGANGAAEVTVRGVCAKAGLTPRYFYEQFDNRDALLLAVADEVRDQLAVTLVVASESEPGDIWDKLNAALTAFLEVVAGDPQVHRILTSDPASVPGLAQQQIAATSRIVELVRENAARLLDRVPPEEELRRNAVFAVGGVNGLIADWLPHRTESPAELAATATRLCRAVARGIDRP
ncbi:TetR/AcrR family transcriptional regulator [Nocardioides maradonensis]